MSTSGQLDPKLIFFPWSQLFFPISLCYLNPDLPVHFHAIWKNSLNRRILHQAKCFDMDKLLFIWGEMVMCCCLFEVGSPSDSPPLPIDIKYRGVAVNWLSLGAVTHGSAVRALLDWIRIKSFIGLFSNVRSGQCEEQMVWGDCPILNRM